MPVTEKGIRIAAYLALLASVASIILGNHDRAQTSLLLCIVFVLMTSY